MNKTQGNQFESKNNNLKFNKERRLRFFFKEFKYWNNVSVFWIFL